jgi:hypothetical protein
VIGAAMKASFIADALNGTVRPIEPFRVSISSGIAAAEGGAVNAGLGHEIARGHLRLDPAP